MANPAVLIANQVMSLPPSTRDAEIERRCDGDAELARQVREMIAMAEMDTQTSAHSDDDPAATLVIEGYRIERLIGRGAMGAVYRARQLATARDVAIKVIRPGLADAETIRRFRSEARTMGKLAHDNIAIILDAGETADQLAYLAMSLIDGETIDHYIDTQKLGQKQIVELIRSIAHAVHHAHQRGVLHRDLKPSNIMVGESDGQPRPYILDFGVARNLEADAEQASLLTRTGELVGTLAYMPPEQIAGEVDVRSDVYAIGVILYQLLSGQRPYDLTGKSLVEALSVIVDQPPTPIREHLPGLERDLMVVVHKAMHHDVSLRYQSAAELADDLERYLNDEPVLAQSPGLWQQCRLLFNRHRTAAITAGLVALTLLVASIVSVRYAVEAEAARVQAEDRNTTLALVNQFVSQMLQAANPEVAGTDVPLRSVIDQAAMDLERLAGKPEIAVELHAVLADTYLALGELEAARTQTDAVAQALESIGPVDPLGPLSVAQALRQASLLSLRGEQAEAAALLQPLVDRREEIPTYRLELVAGYGQYLILLDRQDEAARLLGEYAETPITAENFKAVSTVQHNLAEALTRLGDYEASRSLLEELVRVRTERLGAVHPFTLISRNNLANLLAISHQLDAAEAAFRSLYADRVATLGADHHASVGTLSNLGNVLVRQQKLDEAEPLLREVVEKSTATLGPIHNKTVVARNILAYLLEDTGQLDLAAELYRGLIDDIDQSGQPESVTLASVSNNLGMLLIRQQRAEQAEAYLQRAVAIATRLLGADNPNTAVFENNLGWLMIQLGRLADAESALSRSHAIIEATFGAEHPRTIKSTERLEALAEARGDQDEARD